MALQWPLRPHLLPPAQFLQNRCAHLCQQEHCLKSLVASHSPENKAGVINTAFRFLYHLIPLGGVCHFLTLRSVPTLAAATHSLLFHNETFSLSLEILNMLFLLPRSFSFPKIFFPKSLSHFKLNDTPIEKPAFSSYKLLFSTGSLHIYLILLYMISPRG